jgi:hypothetical protein
MSKTTKPPRLRPGPNHAAEAKHYERLNPEPYAALPRVEQLRHDLHLDLDAIIDAVEFAELDRRSIGFPSTVGGESVRGGGDPGALNGVESASQHPDVDTAVRWLAEWAEARAQVVRVANLARYLYGYDPEIGRAESRRPEARRPDVKPCAWCSEPAATGVRGEDGKLLVRVVDQMPIHRNPCYQTAATQALRAGISVVALLKNLKNRETAGPPR